MSNLIDLDQDKFYKIAAEAANKQMRAQGRTEWDEDDYNLAARTYQNLRNGKSLNEQEEHDDQTGQSDTARTPTTPFKKRGRPIKILTKPKDPNNILVTNPRTDKPVEVRIIAKQHGYILTLHKSDPREERKNNPIQTYYLVRESDMALIFSKLDHPHFHYHMHRLFTQAFTQEMADCFNQLPPVGAPTNTYLRDEAIRLRAQLIKAISMPNKALDNKKYN